MRPHDRTNSRITERKRTPGGELKTYQKDRKKTTVRPCLDCGKPINGTLIKKKLPKTHRNPNRKSSSMLCVNCLENRIKTKVRNS